MDAQPCGALLTIDKNFVNHVNLFAVLCEK